MLDGSKEKKKRTTKRKINWSEYNESFVRRGEMLYDDGFFQKLASRAKENGQRKGGPTLSLTQFLNIAAARHRTCIPTSIPTIRMRYKNDVGTFKETTRDITRLHNKLVMENNNDEDNVGPKSKPGKRRHCNSSR